MGHFAVPTSQPRMKFGSESGCVKEELTEESGGLKGCLLLWEGCEAGDAREVFQGQYLVKS